MQAVKTTGETVNISREQLAVLVSNMFGGAAGNPNPDEPLKPGPWDPVIRKVAKQVFGPHPEPWQLAFGSQPEPWRSESHITRIILEAIAARHPEIFDVIGGGRFTDAELNPQPLPPRAVFLAAFAEEAIDRVLLMQEVADAVNQTGEQQGIIIVGGRLSMLVDELCGNNFKVKIPFPRPKHDEGELLSGLELLAAGAVFERNAATIAHEGLRQELRNAGAKLIETGIARM
ncbi:MAG: hypothetical protein ABI878_04790 [Acidobacteriota bacterium]